MSMSPDRGNHSTFDELGKIKSMPLALDQLVMISDVHSSPFLL